MIARARGESEKGKLIMFFANYLLARVFSFRDTSDLSLSHELIKYLLGSLILSLFSFSVFIRGGVALISSGENKLEIDLPHMRC